MLPDYLLAKFGEKNIDVAEISTMRSLPVDSLRTTSATWSIVRKVPRSLLLKKAMQVFTASH